jgi:zinc protease
MQQTAFPEGTPYYHYWDDDTHLTGIRAAEVADFQRRLFVPRNATLAVTGYVDRDEVVRLTTKYFGSLAGGATLERPSEHRVRLDGETRIEVAAPIQSTTVTIVWPTPAHFTPGDAELDAVAGILDGVRTSRLRWEVESNKHLVTSITASQHSWRYASELEIAATVRQGHTPDEVIAAIDAVLGDLQTSQPTTDEFNGAILPMLVKRALGFERSFSRAMHYVEWSIVTGGPDFMRRDFERYALDPARILATAKRELPLDRRVVSIVTPDASAPRNGVLRRRTFKAAP